MFPFSVFQNHSISKHFRSASWRQCCWYVCEGGVPNGMVGGYPHPFRWLCGTVGLVAWGAWEVLLGQEERTLFLHRRDLSYREAEFKGSFGASWCLAVGTMVALPGQWGDFLGDFWSLSHRRLLNTKMSNLYLRLQKSIYWKGCPWPVWFLKQCDLPWFKHTVWPCWWRVSAMSWEIGLLWGRGHSQKLHKDEHLVCLPFQTQTAPLA